VFDQMAEAREVLTGLGLFEAQGQTLIGEEAARLVARSPDTVVFAENPLSSEMNVLRPSLLPGLLDTLRHNASRREHDAGLFEIGRVFVQSGGEVKEQRRLALALTGDRQPGFWSGEQRGQKYDIYDLKGLVEEFLEAMGVRATAWAPRSPAGQLYLEAAQVRLGSQEIGEFGQLTPPLARQYDLRNAVFLAELDLDFILTRRNRSKTFKPMPALPSVRRDLAIILPETVTHEAVLGLVRQMKSAILESAEIFDVFRGKNVPEGHKSVAYAFTYRHASRTLTDAEVNAEQERLTERLQTALGAQVRA